MFGACSILDSVSVQLNSPGEYRGLRISLYLYLQAWYATMGITQFHPTKLDLPHALCLAAISLLGAV